MGLLKRAIKAAKPQRIVASAESIFVTGGQNSLSYQGTAGDIMTNTAVDVTVKDSEGNSNTHNDVVGSFSGSFSYNFDQDTSVTVTASSSDGTESETVTVEGSGTGDGGGSDDGGSGGDTGSVSFEGCNWTPATVEQGGLTDSFVMASNTTASSVPVRVFWEIGGWRWENITTSTLDADGRVYELHADPQADEIISNVSEGTHSVTGGLIIDGAYEVSGSCGTVEVVHPAPEDASIVTATIANTSVSPSGEVTVQVDVTNEITSGGGLLQTVQPTLNSGGEQYDIGDTRELYPGSTDTFTLTGAGLPAGEQEVCAHVSANQADDIQTCTMVTIPEGESNVSVTIDETTQPAAGELVIEYTVANDGTSQADVQTSVLVDGSEMTTESVSLAAGESEVVEATVTGLSAGTHEVCIETGSS